MTFAKLGKAMSHFAHAWYGSFLIGAVLGVGVFGLTFDFRFIDPTFIDWLLTGQDTHQHFLGWEFYRHEPWTLPLGEISQLAYPFGISLSYTDSIPLFAIPFKLFASILPDNFQYFGIWGLLCYVLQGGIAALIIRRWTRNPIIVGLVALVFVLSPILMARMFAHTALAGHWIILLAIWALIERHKIVSLKSQIVVWSGLLSLAVLVHPYFLPMVALPFIVSVILLHKTWLATVLKAVIPPVVAVIIFWLIGGFAVGGESSGEGLGSFQLNIDSLFNPLGWSLFLSNLHEFNGESMNYLGGGMILLLAVTLFIASIKYDTFAKLKKVLRKLTWRYVLVALCFVTLTVAALSPRIMLGTKGIELDLPQKIVEYWAIFRSSARLFWIVYYMIILGVLVYIIKAFKGRSQIMLAAFLTLFVGVQAVDITLSARAKEQREVFYHLSDVDFTARPLLNFPQWEAVIKDRRHLVYLDKLSHHDFFTLSHIATKHRLSMNTGYFARAPQAAIAAYQQEQITALLEGNADLSTNLYITKDKDLVRQLSRYGYTMKLLDGFYVLVTSNSQK